eukprot:CAMPEP_0170610024 /NCGR_PEP_ID=MMETSP0224-20130122/22433_1 /TAXON_ID=285029 /ORGANISM="Togula jolla, Strain CCCM 725" /LENGTH=66 /DNA_ID=CAMNT_0010935361 /DNA_START=32 /DNA_END=232 /DNA_ORIENTATION=-
MAADMAEADLSLMVSPIGFQATASPCTATRWCPQAAGAESSCPLSDVASASGTRAGTPEAGRSPLR